MRQGRHNGMGPGGGLRWWRGLRACLLIGLAILLLGLPRQGAAALGTPTRPLPVSSESLALQSFWNRSETYPLDLRPRADLYRPSAEWMGRLLLPNREEIADRQAPQGDWVWIELEQAPADRQAWIGRRVRLRWAEGPALQRLVATVTTDIRLGDRARRAATEANVVPTRLNGRRQVGPLQSLAGARPLDDVTVLLEGVRWQDDALRIARPPVQITGRWQGLVRFEGPPGHDGAMAPAAAHPAGAAGAGPSVAAAASRAPAGPWTHAPSPPSPPPSGSEDFWQVRHYNRASGRFDGPAETIRLPSLPRDRFGRRMFDPTGLAASPLNRDGWLIQGAPAFDGVFTVQAIEPRALLTPTPERRVEGTSASLAHLMRGNWSPAQLRRGSLQRTALIPDGAAAPLWQPGERALLMHLFGGIGGRDGEPVALWTATGHFAFGEAQVVRDAFSGQPRLAIRYHQIYANNPNGIVAGSQDWSAYGGNLQRGWLGTRPFSDVLIPMGAEALDAIALQAEILAARYRSGDGGGVALVTPATSCVQDSAQALWIALQQLRQRGEGSGAASTEAERLRRLGLALDHLLAPFGRVRADWVHNSTLTLAEGVGRFQTSQRLRDVLLSWRSLLPRGAHDTFAAEVLRAGLPLQVLRTNQIPGLNPRLEPIAPTVLLGQLPVAGTLLARLGDGLFPPPRPEGRFWPLLILIVYTPLALALGRRDGFLPRAWRWPPMPQLLRRGTGLMVMPAFVEELLFRGLLLPHPLEGVPPLATVGWIALSTGLFVLYHPLAGRLWYRQGRALFDDPRFLLQCSLLGVACGLAYSSTGSLWWAVLIHWLAVFVWLEPLQGRLRLGGREGPRLSRGADPAGASPRR